MDSLCQTFQRSREYLCRRLRRAFPFRYTCRCCHLQARDSQSSMIRLGALRHRQQEHLLAALDEAATVPFLVVKLVDGPLRQCRANKAKRAIDKLSKEERNSSGFIQGTSRAASRCSCWRRRKAPRRIIELCESRACR